MDSILIALPGLLISSISALPLGLGLLAAKRHMRAGARVAYLSNLNGSIAAGVVILLLLWGSLFGNDLSSSSTAALIFLFAPIYAAAAQGIVYGISRAAIGKSTSSTTISTSLKRAILVPLSLLLVLLFGLLKTSAEGNELAVAERGSNPDTLQHLYEQSLTGEVDSFGVPLFLAQNPNTPPEILAELSKHRHPAVRVQVAQHTKTPKEIVYSLRNDCASFVRKAVEKRLGPNKALQPTPKCGAAEL